MPEVRASPRIFVELSLVTLNVDQPRTMAYTLADIPHDHTGSSGRLLVGDVNAITGSKKRKRSEIAVAVNHQGVNIYDVLALVLSIRNDWANGFLRSYRQS